MKSLVQFAPPEHPERDSYAEAGKAMRESIERAIEQKLTVREWRVLAAVFSLTGCYSRIGDRTFVAQIAAIANLPHRHTQTSLRSLHEQAVIYWQPVQGRGKASWVGLRSPVELALRPLMAVVENAEKVTDSGHLLAVDNPEKVTGHGHVLAAEKVTGASHLLDVKGDRFRSEKVTGPGHPTEKTNEKRSTASILQIEERAIQWVEQIGWQIPSAASIREELAQMGISGSKAEYLVLACEEIRREREAA